ncbi:MAG: pseudouridine-5'-phosphate glycosidase [Bacillota bacterium]
MNTPSQAQPARSSPLKLHPEVAAALREGRPVVALESTIITHGMPHPENLDTAMAVEEEVRRAGSVPATIAVVDGVPRVGLDLGELALLASSNREAVVKVSRRDLPVAVARGLSGGTTVSATMAIAAAAGIRVFVTGGIGGVHRGATETFDISADLAELGRTSVAVVCAGAKAILDLPLTLEYLETLGVPVIGYQTSEFPAFYTRSSGLLVDYRAETPDEIADIMRAKWDLGLDGGIVVANPVPASAELDPKTVEEAIQQALTHAAAEGVRGADLTPFLLSRLGAITGGASLQTNIALVRNNARLGAAVARAWCS